MLISFSFSCQSGRSMLEMIGILIIFGVLTLAAVSLYSMGMERYKINQTIEQIKTVSMQIQELYHEQPDRTGLSIDILYHTGILPSSLKVEGSPLTAKNYGVVVLMLMEMLWNIPLNYMIFPKKFVSFWEVNRIGEII